MLNNGCDRIKISVLQMWNLLSTAFDANDCVSTLVNVDWIKWMYFCVNGFEAGVNDSIFSDNEQQKV